MLPDERKLRGGETLVIREAERRDAERLLEYVEAISGESDYLTYGPGEFTLTLEEEQGYLDRCRASPNDVFLLAEIDGVLVGSLSFGGGARPRTAHAGEFGMAVRREHWGHGIGSALLDALEAWARAGKLVRKLDLRVRVDNEHAIRLYQHKGYVREGLLSRQFFVAGEYHDLICMGLALD